MASDNPFAKYAQPSSQPAAADNPFAKYTKTDVKADTAEPEKPADTPVPEVKEDKPGLGEKALGVLASPGFALAQTIRHPIDSVVDQAVGLYKTPKEAGAKAAQDIRDAGSRFKEMVEPGRSLPSRIFKGGAGALDTIAAPFELPITALENTYGNQASKGSQMANFRGNGQPIVSKGEASILPSLMIGGKKAPAKLDDFGQAATRFGMNFKGAKSAEDIAKEITRATGSYFDKLSNMIWDRSPAVTATGKPGEIATNAIKNFTQRKKEEAALWQNSERIGNSMPQDVSAQVKALQDLRKKVAQRIQSGEDTPDVKKAQALIDRTLSELGNPVQPEQSIVEKTREVGGQKKTIEAQKQFPKDAEQVATTEAEPTITRGPKSVSARTQDPITRSVGVDGKTKTVTTDPYNVTTRTVKGQPPVPPRSSTAGDLVRARRAANDGLYSSADTQVSKEVKDILNGGLSDAAKNNKAFGKTHNQALQKTQANADIYRDDAKAASFGFDEQTLNELRGKMKQGRQLSTATLERINSGVDKIKTPEDLLFLQRHLDKPEFSMALRAKAAAILSETGTDMKKVAAERPMLEKIFEFSGMPKAKYQQALDDLQSVAKEMDKYNIPSNPQVNPQLTKAQARLKSLIKAVTFGFAYSNPKQAIYHGVQAVAPSATADDMALKALKNRVNPPPQTSYTGAAVGAAMGAKDRGDQ